MVMRPAHAQLPGSTRWLSDCSDSAVPTWEEQRIKLWEKTREASIPDRRL